MLSELPTVQCSGLMFGSRLAAIFPCTARSTVDCSCCHPGTRSYNHISWLCSVRLRQGIVSLFIFGLWAVIGNICLCGYAIPSWWQEKSNQSTWDNPWYDIEKPRVTPGAPLQTVLSLIHWLNNFFILFLPWLYGAAEPKQSEIMLPVIIYHILHGLRIF